SRLFDVVSWSVMSYSVMFVRPVLCFFFFFFFQAEDGIRDWSVTGVQTCALPIFSTALAPHRSEYLKLPLADGTGDTLLARLDRPAAPKPRSEEHTSELQSLTNLVCRLLLEKKTA